MKKIQKIVSTTIFTLTSFIFSVLPANAQTSGTGIANPITGTLGDDPGKAASGETFVSYFVDLWGTFISIGGLIVLIMFLWGGLEWITAGGDASKIEKARNRIMQSVLGLLILVSSFVIIGFVSQLFFGEEFSILNLTFTAPGGE